jgi:hypothetical protein
MTFFGEKNCVALRALIIWIGGIFYCSSNKGSMTARRAVFRPAADLLFPRADGERLKFYLPRRPQLVHFFGYAVSRCWLRLFLQFVANSGGARLALLRLRARFDRRGGG